MRPTRLRSPRHSLILAPALAAVAIAAAGCGSSVNGTITVGAAAPTPAQLARATALAASDALDVGPRAARVRVVRGGYAVTIRLAPNRASVANRLTVSVSRAGVPVSGARVTAEAGMLSMDMGVASYRLAGAGPYAATVPAWLMPGLWRLAFSVTPPAHGPIRIVLDDRMLG